MRRFSHSNTILSILCLMYLILYVDRVNISTAAPLIKADLDLSNAELGLVFSAFAYPYALFQLIGGYFSDKFGPRLTLFVSGLRTCVSHAPGSAFRGRRPKANRTDRSRRRHSHRWHFRPPIHGAETVSGHGVQPAMNLGRARS